MMNIRPIYLDKSGDSCERDRAVAVQIGNLRQCARGGKPQLLINGKWSPITLETTPPALVSEGAEEAAFEADGGPVADEKKPTKSTTKRAK